MENEKIIDIKEMNEEQMLRYLLGLLKWLVRERELCSEFRYNDCVEFKMLKERCEELAIVRPEVLAIMTVLECELNDVEKKDEAGKGL